MVCAETDIVTPEPFLEKIEEHTLLNLVDEVVNGKQTKAESLGLGEIFAPRVVRSV